MSTESQQNANLANSQLSTGPKTEAGKAISSQNNYQHGLLSYTTGRPLTLFVACQLRA